jgi:PKD repeat protein
MEKNVMIVVIVVIILVLAGAGYAVFLFYGDTFESKEKPKTEPETQNKKPVAFFKGNTSGVVGHELNFDANGSRDNDGFITSYKWNFGDGAENTKSYTDPNSTKANHTYITPGTFTVNLTVRDNMGATDSYSLKVTIRPQDYEKSESTVLLERLGISNVNETIPIEVFVVSLWINVSFVGASSGTIPQLGDATLEVSLTDPYGIIIANETKESKLRNVYLDFYFDDPETLIPGQYDLTMTCLEGALVLDYEIIVRY